MVSRSDSIRSPRLASCSRKAGVATVVTMLVLEQTDDGLEALAGDARGVRSGKRGWWVPRPRSGHAGGSLPQGQEVADHQGLKAGMQVVLSMEELQFQECQDQRGQQAEQGGREGDSHTVQGGGKTHV